MNKQISDVQLEQYLLGELEPEKIALIEEERRNNPEIENRINLIEKSNADILAMYTPEYFSSLVRRKTAKNVEPPKFLTKERLRSFIWVFSTAAVFSVMLLVLYPTMLNRTISYDFLNENETTRIKGSSALLIYRRDGSSLQSGDIVQAGDNVQLFYRNDSYRYGAIISVDGRGIVTRHFPLDSEDAAELAKGERTILPQSYVFDDAPEYEVFYFFYSQKPFSVGSLESEIKASFSSDPDLMREIYIQTKGVEYTVVSLRKQ